MIPTTTTTTTTTSISASSSCTNDEDEEQQHTTKETEQAAIELNTNESKETTNDHNTNTISEPTTTIVRTLITANIGDSRAILCRNGQAIILSRDHKPNDPIEYQRIRQLGGTVTWDGPLDRMHEPIPGMGCYRVNGYLALSRVIGDRWARPVVNSDPDITLITLRHPEDEFIVVATDGLWDYMSSSDTVAFIRALLDNVEYDAMDRDSIATYVVEEALRRGSDDNITVIIVWLK
jgi:protein phosphatase 1L